MILTRHLTTSLLTELEDDIDRDKLKRLLHYSRRLAGFRNRSKLVGVALEEVLEQGTSVCVTGSDVGDLMDVQMRISRRCI